MDECSLYTSSIWKIGKTALFGLFILLHSSISSLRNASNSFLSDWELDWYGLEYVSVFWCLASYFMTHPFVSSWHLLETPRRRPRDHVEFGIWIVIILHCVTILHAPYLWCLTKARTAIRSLMSWQAVGYAKQAYRAISAPYCWVSKSCFFYFCSIDYTYLKLFVFKPHF